MCDLEVICPGPFFRVEFDGGIRNAKSRRNRDLLMICGLGNSASVVLQPVVLALVLLLCKPTADGSFFHANKKLLVSFKRGEICRF